MKWSENVTSFGIKRDCNWLDLDKVSLKLASKNLVHSKLKPHGKGFPYGLLQAENIRSACCSRVVLSKLLAARKANFLFLLVLAKKIAVLEMLANARKDHRHPFRCHIQLYSYIVWSAHEWLWVYCGLLDLMLSLSYRFICTLLALSSSSMQDFWHMNLV